MKTRTRTLMQAFAAQPEHRLNKGARLRKLWANRLWGSREWWKRRFYNVLFLEP